MKKVLPIILAIAMAAPAFAAVNITAVDNGAQGLDISYDCTAGEAIRGVALKIEVTGGQADLVTLNPMLNAYIDYYYQHGVTELPGEGHPVAMVGEAGPLALPAATFVISAGALNEAQEGLSGSGSIGTIDLSGAGAEACVTITLDPLRGGVVGDNVADVTVPAAPVCVELIVVPPFPSCQDYNLTKKKAGLTDNICNVSDINNFISYVNSNKIGPFFSIPTSNPAFDADYDFDMSGTINVTDLNKMITYINLNKTGPFFAYTCPQ